MADRPSFPRPGRFFEIVTTRPVAVMCVVAAFVVFGVVALGKLPRIFWQIDADRDRRYTGGCKLIDVFLNSPQLGDAKRSPVATIENQQHAFLF